MAFLEDLPAPLPLHILEQLPDLVSLDAARRSSPLFRDVFTGKAVELFEHLMQRSLLDDVVVAIRVYILLDQRRKLSSPDGGDHSSMSDLQEVFAIAQHPLDCTTSKLAICNVVGEFSYVACIGNKILLKKLKHLHELPHEHLENKQFRWTRSPDHLPVGRPYTLKQSSPPCWEEQQRILRALWYVKISEDFGCSLWQLLSQLPSTQDSNASSRVPHDSQVEETGLCYKKLTADGQIVKDFRFWEPLAPPPLPAVKATTEDVSWGNTLEMSSSRAHRVSGEANYIRNVASRTTGNMISPLEEPILQGLGIGIWSKRRMAEELELSNFPRSIKPPSEGQIYKIGVDDFLSQDDLLFTWSQLAKAELAFNQARERGASSNDCPI